jgi:diguanylate cyclase (GGDEF)-like protein
MGGSALRRDALGRYGGEEFAVGLIETDEKTALHVAERIRKSIEKREFKAYGESLKITISIGCATCSPVFNSVNQLIEGADMALYQAKHLGRNQVCTAGC